MRRKEWEVDQVQALVDELVGEEVSVVKVLELDVGETLTLTR